MCWTFGINMKLSSTGGGAAQAVRIEGAAFPGGPFPRPPWLSGLPERDERDRQWRGGLPAAGLPWASPPQSACQGGFQKVRVSARDPLFPGQ